MAQVEIVVNAYLPDSRPAQFCDSYFSVADIGLIRPRHYCIWLNTFSATLLTKPPTRIEATIFDFMDFDVLDAAL